jgi:hypothetical protein
MQYNERQEFGIVSIGEINTAFSERLKKQSLKNVMEYRVNITAFGLLNVTASLNKPN